MGDSKNFSWIYSTPTNRREERKMLTINSTNTEVVMEWSLVSLGCAMIMIETLRKISSFWEVSWSKTENKGMCVLKIHCPF